MIRCTISACKHDEIRNDKLMIKNKACKGHVFSLLISSSLPRPHSPESFVKSLDQYSPFVDDVLLFRLQLFLLLLSLQPLQPVLLLLALLFSLSLLLLLLLLFSLAVFFSFVFCFSLLEHQKGWILSGESGTSIGRGNALSEHDEDGGRRNKSGE